MSNSISGDGPDQTALLKELEKLEAGESVTTEERSAEREKRERAEARDRAARLGLEFVDLRDFKIDHGLFRAIPVDLMFRYIFVPCKKHDGVMEVVVADPTFTSRRTPSWTSSSSILRTSLGPNAGR